MHCQSPLGEIYKCLLCTYYVQGAMGAAINHFIWLLKVNVPLGEYEHQREDDWGPILWPRHHLTNLFLALDVSF